MADEIDSGMTAGLEQEIISELAMEYKKDPGFDIEIIAIKVRDAYRKVRAKKGYYNTNYSEEQIEKDLYNKHFQDIKDVARYNYVTIGGDFQVSHTENGVGRVWRTEDEVLGNIVAYVKVL